jgi:cell division protein FtsQ
VNTTGIAVSSANSILTDMGVKAGSPMIRISETATEAALLEDPWIADADLSLSWPNEISVAVVERVPVAWVETADGWSRRAIDGVALPSAEVPDGEYGVIEMPHLTAANATGSTELIGAVEFLAHLSPGVARETLVTFRDSELWASVRGYAVRLGRQVEMREKAIGLEALLAQNLPEGSSIVLIAPTTPAVSGSATGQEEGAVGETGEEGSEVEGGEAEGGAADAETDPDQPADGDEQEVGPEDD